LRRAKAFPATIARRQGDGEKSGDRTLRMLGRLTRPPLPDQHAGAICLSLSSVQATNFPEVDSMKDGARGPGGGIVTAALLVIGDEILSGRTKDKNIGYIADYLTAIGIDLKEVRVVGDDAAAIVEAVNTLRARHTYLFTTGGIGPTHDDITADCVATAFGVSIDHDPRAVAILRERFLTTGAEMNEARMRMTRIPAGADLVHNKVSAAPGFWLDNVIVMAGVPTIMQAMLDEVAPQLKTGVRVLSETLRADAREGDIGTLLGEIAKAHPDVTIGSYPFFDEGRGPNTNVVVRARDAGKLSAATKAVKQMLARVKER